MSGKTDKSTTRPAVLWFTGLSGSGKSTIADEVAQELALKKVDVERLDGDQIRGIFPGTGFTREERDNHIKRIGYIASLLEKHGVTVIASFVSPYAGARNHIRKLCKNFVEIHVSTSLEECERRDVKGLYKKARAGEIKNFTGIDDPYEPPDRSEIVLDTTGLTVKQAAARVIEHFLRH